MEQEQLKICGLCKTEKPLLEFYKAIGGKFGVGSRCKACLASYFKQHYKNNKEHINAVQEKYYLNNKKQISEYHRNRRRENPEVYAARSKKYDEENKEKISEARKEHRRNNPELYVARNRKYREDNHDRELEKSKKYRRENPGICAAQLAKRRARKLQATPLWADLKAIQAIYIECARLCKETGIDYVVDHVIPLQGRKVSGLHVHTNLQIITREENAKKHNKFDVELN